MSALLSYIREKRKEKGFTQVELAKQLGMNESYYNEFENGRKRTDPSPFFLQDIAYCLGVPYIELMKRAGYLEGLNQTEFDLIKENEELKRRLNQIKRIIS